MTRYIHVILLVIAVAISTATAETRFWNEGFRALTKDELAPLIGKWWTPSPPNPSNEAPSYITVAKDGRVMTLYAGDVLYDGTTFWHKGSLFLKSTELGPSRITSISRDAKSGKLQIHQEDEAGGQLLEKVSDEAPETIEIPETPLPKNAVWCSVRDNEYWGFQWIDGWALQVSTFQHTGGSKSTVLTCLPPGPDNAYFSGCWVALDPAECAQLISEIRKLQTTCSLQLKSKTKHDSDWQLVASRLPTDDEISKTISNKRVGSVPIRSIEALGWVQKGPDDYFAGIDIGWKNDYSPNRLTMSISYDMIPQLLTLLEASSKNLAPLNDGQKVAKLVQQGKDAHSRLNYQAAADFFSEAIKLSPDNAEIYRLRGSAYYGMIIGSSRASDYVNVFSDYNRAIMLDPKNDDAYHSRGCCYLELQEWDKAIADFTNELECSSDERKSVLDVVYYCRSQAYIGKRDYSSALIDCLESIRLSPKSEAYRERYEQVKRLRDNAQKVPKKTP